MKLWKREKYKEKELHSFIQLINTRENMKKP